MTLLPHKRCPSCRARFEGEAGEVRRMRESGWSRPTRPPVENKAVSGASEDRKGWEKPTRPPTGQNLPQGLPPKPGMTPPQPPPQEVHSCEVCGHPSLTTLPDINTDAETQQAPLPRGGGQTITHTRDNF